MDHMKDKTDKANPLYAVLIAGSLVCSPGLYATDTQSTSSDKPYSPYADRD